MNLPRTSKGQKKGEDQRNKAALDGVAKPV